MYQFLSSQKLFLTCLALVICGAKFAHSNHRIVDEHRISHKKIVFQVESTDACFCEDLRCTEECLDEDGNSCEGEDLNDDGVVACHRMESMAVEERYYTPSPLATKALSLGHQTMVSDFFWIRTVLLYSDFSSNCTKENAQWLKAMIMNSSTLDPGWRTLYFYGGSMLQVCDDIDGSDEVFLLGHKNIPEDSYFPFSLSSNASLYHKDTEKALYWMREAVKLPNAPPWYEGVITTLLREDSGIAAASLYAEAQLELQEDPKFIEFLEEKLRSLYHDQRVEILENKRQSYIQATGTDINNISDLYPLIDKDGQPIRDPYEGPPWQSYWILAPDKVIRSQEMDRRQAHKDLAAERRIMKWKGRRK